MYESRIADASIDKFFEALSVLESKEDYYRFFEDVCTVVELKMHRPALRGGADAFGG